MATPRAVPICKEVLLRPEASPASCSANYLAANTGANPLVVLTEGYRSAFVACAVLAGIGLALALLLPGRPRKAAHEVPEPVPATSATHAARGDGT